MSEKTLDALVRRDKLLGEAGVLCLCALERIKEAGLVEKGADTLWEWQKAEVYRGKKRN